MIHKSGASPDWIFLLYTYLVALYFFVGLVFVLFSPNDQVILP